MNKLEILFFLLVCYTGFNQCPRRIFLYNRKLWFLIVEKYSVKIAGYHRAEKKKREGEQMGFMVFLLVAALLAGAVGVAGYYYRDYKKKEYMLDYEVRQMVEDKEQKQKKAELDSHIREEQKNKKFYLDVILTHGNAIGVKSSSDNEGKRRCGILSIGEIKMIGKNSRGEDYLYRIDEAGMEIWATFEKDELLLKSQNTPFEIRKEGMARDQGTRTQKAVIKADQQYYIILGSRHEIGLLAQRS